MTAVYLIFTVLSLFNCMLPAGVFSMIWEQISSNMTVGVPYIAIIRVLIAFGIILAVVLSDRIRAYLLCGREPGLETGDPGGLHAAGPGLCCDLGLSSHMKKQMPAPPAFF